MKILEIDGLSKTYPAFQLSNVSFSLEAGKITGFIGRNGAGKSTTLKSMLNFVHPDSGSVRFFDMDFAENELAVKHRIGFVSGGFEFYSKKKIKAITAVTKKFYDRWDDAAYRAYLQLFHLDENKTPSELSEGMKVKYSLVLALSHNAELLILDEPTSGLDPVSRDELLTIFLELCDKGITILFSTHITSDLDKCADNIIYIQNGKVIADTTVQRFTKAYRLAVFPGGEVLQDVQPLLIGNKRIKEGCSAIVKASDAAALENVGISTRAADLEEIMVHMEQEGA